MKLSNNFLIIFFWILVVFYLDPGGIFDVLSDSYWKDIFLQYGVTGFMWILLSQDARARNSGWYISPKLVKYNHLITIWLIYYLLWFYWINTDFFPGTFKLITHNSRMVGQLFLVVPIAYFSYYYLEEFVKVTTIITISVLLLFFFSIVSGIEILKVLTLSRGTIEVNRYFMYGDGLVFFSLPLALSFLLIKLKRPVSIIIAGGLVVVFIIITVTRRSIIGILEYYIIILFFISYINNQKVLMQLFKLVKVRTILILIASVVLMSSVFPHVIENSKIFVQDIANIFLYQETIEGTKEIRLSLTGKVEIVEAIRENFIGGTGFDPDWNSGSGGEKGWEGSDYIFLSSFGMYGLVGLLIFIPFYILAVKRIIGTLKFLKRNIHLVNSNLSKLYIPLIVFFASSSEFVKNILEYPNWFYPIGAIGDSSKYFIYFGLLFGSSINIMNKLVIINNNIKDEN